MFYGLALFHTLSYMYKHFQGFMRPLEPDYFPGDNNRVRVEYKFHLSTNAKRAWLISNSNGKCGYEIFNYKCKVQKCSIKSSQNFKLP